MEIYLACYDTDILAAFKNIEDAIDYLVEDAVEGGCLEEGVTREMLEDTLREDRILYDAWFVQEITLN